MNFGNLQSMMNPGNAKVGDNSEKIIISSLALLKMLKHGRAGVPLEVMGLMLGSFVDEYTTNVVDVFAMPQSGTGVSVEAVDPVFQQKMIEMLKQTGREENVVGWYHSHPGFGCWLSGIDVGTQQSFEKLDPRNCAVVVDPIQSVKGKVVIDCFRTIPTPMMMTGEEPRQTTSNEGMLTKPTSQALYNGLNKYYFSMIINYCKEKNEQNMLLNLYKTNWTKNIKLKDTKKSEKNNVSMLEEMEKLSEKYIDYLKDENKKSKNEFYLQNIGKINPKKHLNEISEKLITNCKLENFSISVAIKVM